MFFKSKKAMSPLIATVLLIAFAVALGTMIMNWSAGIESGGDLNSDVGCTDISLTTTKNICYENNALHLTLTNDGKNKLNAVSVNIKNVAQELDMTMRVKDSTIIPGETIERNLPTLNPGIDSIIEVTPMILSGGKLVACVDTGFEQQKLVDCK